MPLSLLWRFLDESRRGLGLEVHLIGVRDRLERVKDTGKLREELAGMFESVVTWQSRAYGVACGDGSVAIAHIYS